MMRLGLADKIVAKLLLWRRIAVQREELGRMSDELLKDIGISRAEAAQEAQRHFWDTDIPQTRAGRQETVPELKLRYH
ncbi:Uncharacterized conserved protein YjiS, DUF1127 family [Malonomonas rubra DSM 5091]|uniref:Uncharacterized conserved protein YjiS, DUF1127 family n=1 Tax=Malonomonas rubra DSM 5091 TaxID=1122189 RepID=A0A1M6G694_MALRU|nr:DUF1127 domain-containing protein [Malonomonas rubra]SHJ05464.1 Uncharacterized conserved protein YjiS, DUF1127 family [Malonomonas rubra DSM 5091]